MTLGIVWNSVTDWFDDYQPIFNDDYTTEAFGRRSREILEKQQSAPQFLYLSLNAPHDPVLAPPELRQHYRAMFPTAPDSRVELLASIRAIDIEMEKIVKLVSVGVEKLLWSTHISLGSR